MSEQNHLQVFVDQVISSQKRVAWQYGLASVLVAVLLAWLLSRADMAEITRQLQEYRCVCKGGEVQASGNHVTINGHAQAAESVADRLTRDVLMKQGHINANMR